MMQRRGTIATGACIAAFGILIGLPALSTGATDEGKLRSFEAAPRATSANPRTEPPLHGTNPHGQGTAAVVDLAPSAERPYSVNTNGTTDSEDIVVGRARGEQRPDGTYHGHITILALMGNEILGVDTNPGESRSGPLEPVQQALLTPLCDATANAICLEVLTADSTTTNTGSTNRFEAANVRLGGPAGLGIGAVESNGNISSTADCQTSHGDSNVADVRAGGAVTVEVARSSTDSQACRGLAPTQTNDSVVLNLGGSVGLDALGVPLGVPIPIPGVGCAEGAPDSETGLPLLLPIVCNADDTNGTQAAAPYGVRNALDVYVLATGDTALAKLSTASSESLAVAPAAAVTPPPPPPPTNPPPAVTPPPPPPVTPATPVATTTPTASDDGSGDSGNPGSSDTNDGGDGGGAAQCSDKVDNDGDGVIDSADPGCHSDGNANNPASYNPNDDSEANGALADADKLPFTGADLLGVGLGGTLLLAAGLAIRGRTRRPRLGS